MLLWSLLLCAAILYLAALLFGYSAYLPAAGAGLVAAVVCTYRLSNLKHALPHPHGRGKVTTIDPRAASRAGLTMVLGGAAFFVAIFGSVFLLAPFNYFVLLFSVMCGLPLSQVAYFIVVSAVERSGRMTIYRVTEEDSQEGKDVLIKSVETTPWREG